MVLNGDKIIPNAHKPNDLRLNYSPHFLLLAILVVFMRIIQ